MRSQKYNTTTVKLGPIFEKSRLSIVILKIMGVTPQLEQNSKPARNFAGQCLYVYFWYMWVGIVFNIS